MTTEIRDTGAGARIVLHTPAHTNEGYVWEVGVELVADCPRRSDPVGIHARGVVDVECPDDGRDAGLAGFFQELAGSWRGWAGERTWRSLCGCLRLDATHDGAGHVSVAATLAPLYQGWSARVVVKVEAGEQLNQFAADLREQFRRPPDVSGADGS